MRCDLVALLIGIAACGGSQHPAPSSTPCEQVAEHLLALAEHDNHDVATASLANGVQSEASRQCRDTPWTEARRHCLILASTQEQTLGCPDR
jgi:hypothetical protein